MIASGPAYPDASTTKDAEEIVERYDIRLSTEARERLQKETPKTLESVETVITGSVSELCRAAAKRCVELGYDATILTDTLDMEARDAGKELARVAKQHARDGRKQAYLMGGETIVHLTGSGLGGRNQELALSAAEEIAGFSNILVFSVGSDGTDGPTDAAGGIVDGETKALLHAQGILIPEALRENDSYHALANVDGLIITGPTGTNVNDVAVALIDI